MERSKTSVSYTNCAVHHRGNFSSTYTAAVAAVVTKRPGITRTTTLHSAGWKSLRQSGEHLCEKRCRWRTKLVTHRQPNLIISMSISPHDKTF